LSWPQRLARNPWWAPLAWMAVIFWFSAQPDLPHVPDALLDFLVKKSAHALEYAVLTGLLWRAVARTWPGLRGERRAVLLTGAATVVYAASDEFHQWFVPGRTSQPRDVLIDALGAALAVALIVRYTIRA
jgi:VanZ family protein